MASRVTVVIATRDRRDELAHTLRRLRGLPDRPEIIVVDNASADGTAEAVRRDFPGVRVLALRRNLGAVARNLGVEEARTPYVAFSDDDSWWEPGALDTAAELFDAHPRLGLIAGRPLVGDERRPDPIAGLMADSPLPADDRLPGPAVLGFLCCAAIVRRKAFLEVGGFSEVLFFVGEERLLAYDLAAAGWGLSYVSSVVAVHRPSPVRDSAERRRGLELRNEMLTAWLRRPVPLALARTLSLAGRAATSAAARSAWPSALVRLPAALRDRRRLPESVERHARLLETV
ncbi:glycosyltransferase family 2 protein [Actinoallomurus iriomotensis]|uniref:Glycosyl transferase n=1 Tax=Actinoallomurus iriomotensis TaxID=478107 RepID=A0A9W6S4Z5_9ACTN|nr:glycosyltransferase [Actinoallomurus iriomotensis]GLY85842.1 glycosyl transferase [Actinoallomurus iriomotensis]